jgi:alanine racemase
MLRPVVARSVETIRPTRAVIDLAALAHNLAEIRKHCSAAEVYAVIKADAYGHGAVPVAQRLAAAGADGLCVALPEEGIELREAGIRLPILVLGGTYGRGAADTLAFGLTPVVHDIDQVAALHAAGRGRPVRVHLKVDTGMSRLGVPDGALARFLWRARRHPSVVFDGFMSHLACAEQDPDVTRDQLLRFRRALCVARDAGVRPRVTHLANSAAVLRYPETHFDLVRPGLTLYGVSPVDGLGTGLRQVMQVQTEIVQIKELAPGDRVSYGGRFAAHRPTRIAVLPLGYADGVPQQMANGGPVLVRGRRASIVGAVCMDMCMVDVTDIAHAAVGDEVVLLGAQGGERITANELARIVGSVPHDVLTSVSRRVPRFYER